MAQEVELPDGTIAEFPDDMSHADIENVLQQHFSGQATKQTEPPISAAQDVLDSALYRGAPEAMAAATPLGYSANIVNGVSNLLREGVHGLARLAGTELPYVNKNPIPSSSDMLRASSKALLGKDLYEPKTTAGEYANTLMQFGLGGKLLGAPLKTSIPAALASEAAGQETKGTAWEGPARLAAGLAGGAGANIAYDMGGKIARTGSNIAGNAANRTMALFGSDEAAGRLANNILAKQLIAEGKTPEQVASAIADAQSVGMKPTLGEATGSSGVLQAEKSILRGTGQGANTMRETVFNRNRDAVPTALTKFADKLKAQAGDVSGKYADASDEFTKRSMNANMAVRDPATAVNIMLDDAKGLSAGDKASTRVQTAISERLDELGGVSNIESRALSQANKIMKNAKRRGNTFDALLDAKKQLDDLYIEGADAATQKNASRYVGSFTKEINNALEQMAPTKFREARKSAMTNSAANDLLDAINSTNEGSLGQLYNKFWAKPEVRADFLRRLPNDDLRTEAQKVFGQLEKVRRGFGGSDTAFNLPANKMLSEEAGLGFDPNLANPFESVPTFLQAVGRRIQPRVYDQLANQSVNPDTAALIAAMERNGSLPTAISSNRKLLQTMDKKQVFPGLLSKVSPLNKSKTAKGLLGR